MSTTNESTEAVIEYHGIAPEDVQEFLDERTQRDKTFAWMASDLYHVFETWRWKTGRTAYTRTGHSASFFRVLHQLTDLRRARLKPKGRRNYFVVGLAPK